VLKPDTTSSWRSQATRYVYSPRQQLLGVTKEGVGKGQDGSYGFDVVGNLVKQVLGAGSAAVTTTSTFVKNQLASMSVSKPDPSKPGSSVQASSSAYAYDEFGRLASITGKTGPVGAEVLASSTSYTFDGFDRMVAEASRQYDGSGVVTSSSSKSTVFDPLDRPSVETVTSTGGASGDKSRKTRFTKQVAAEEQLDANSAWQITKAYSYGAGGGPLALTSTPLPGTNGVSGTRYFSTNPHGDAEVLTDPGTGQAKSVYRYTAYGSEDSAGSSKGNLGEDATPTGTVDPTRDVLNPYRYSSKRVDGSDGSYDMGFRTYSPGLNSFTSRDMYNGALTDVAMGMDPWNANRYAFAGGNPISHVDLDGHRAVEMDTGAACDAQCAADLDAYIHPPAAEEHHWYDGAKDWVGDHKADIAGIATSIAVGVACEVATAGAGSVGCLVAAGAAGAAVTNAMDPNADHSFGGYAKAAGFGAVTGLAGAGLGKLAGAGVRAVASKVGGKLAAGTDNLVSAVHSRAATVVASQSIRQRGPVLTGAMDRQTGEVFFGQNTGIPSPLHSALGAALDAFSGPGAAGKGIPGAHSEFNAINQGLFARPGAAISDFLLYRVRLRGADQGSQIMMCPNCANILKGAEDLFQ